MAYRPGPQLQSTRSQVSSFDNGTVTPLPLPYADLWDLNTVPNAGLTQVYQVTNIAEYQGRIIHINKTQNTAGSTIRLTLPGGYTFSTSGTVNYDFPSAASAIILCFTASSVVMVIAGGYTAPASSPITQNIAFVASGEGVDADLQSITIPANTFSAAGQSLRVYCYFEIVVSGIASNNPTLQTQWNNVTKSQFDIGGHAAVDSPVEGIYEAQFILTNNGGTVRGTEKLTITGPNVADTIPTISRTIISNVFFTLPVASANTFNLATANFAGTTYEVTSLVVKAWKE